MNRRGSLGRTASANASLWSFLLRVGLIATVLAVPIISTSFALVSQVNRDIALARAEHVTVVHFNHVVDTFEALNILRERIEAGDAAGVARERAIVDRVINETQSSYSGPSSAGVDFWPTVRSRWNRANRGPTTGSVDAALDAFGEAGNELENNSALDQDPNVVIQNLTDLFLRKAARSIVALSATRDAVTAAGEQRERLDLQTAERISRRLAVEQQSLRVGLSDIDLATSIDPALEPRFATLLRSAKTQTAMFESDVSTVLAASVPGRGFEHSADMSAHRSIAAYVALWRRTQNEIDKIVVKRLDVQLVRRRIIVGFAALAIIAGALVVTLVSRYEARRDRVELRSAKLEADSLRAEVERIWIQRDLRVQEAQFRAIFENADLGIATFDRSGRSLRYNAAATKMLGSTTETLLAEQHDAVLCFDAPGYRPFTREQTLAGSEGRMQWLALTFSGVYDEDVCQLVILLIRDTTEEKLLAQQLSHDARHDGLTGLSNRRAFDEVLRLALMAVHQEPFAVMYIDLDKFKPVNDAFGHRAGDQVLVTTAKRLRSAVGPQDVCARLGGDEFAILLRGVDAVAPLATIAARVTAIVAMPIDYDNGAALSVTASIGVAIGSSRYASVDELKHDADLALYAVKERGRDGFLINQRYVGQPPGMV